VVLFEFRVTKPGLGLGEPRNAAGSQVAPAHRAQQIRKMSEPTHNQPPDRNNDASSESERDRLVREIERRGGIHHAESGCDPQTELDFLRYVVDWETGKHRTHREWLAERGMIFPPPSERLAEDPEQLRELLNNLIDALHKARVFLHCTDHLSDADLYKRLWTDVLDGEAPDTCRTQRNAIHFDLADPMQSREEAIAWLTYYADDEERAEWKSNFPEMPLPPKLPMPNWD
jgi:hypothetical protein